ncbi:AmmeMemoRadiSam system protein B [Dactylosporangium aurantiacum]|uniref:MEMO1 family protein Daura_51025 n=1 Tax=Dactylosporangium aurantiacum TaxID=35754 RepID=A0A9Q9IKD0_9ACTN|nr:AmmeMemoRadiSam system protein B [Dactylosporangium aurantiacum]MDG6110145.1 AmmeMemoRadiSam system protein B [Dactylosporangium aurantiacum]UWZ54658.1 AmmeMemoRadiSam system protein B [Dactylosporangium aurantiacum]
MTRPSTTRPEAVAGTFYPADPAQLTAMIDGLLDAAPPASAPPAAAYVVPHAGYRWSGPTAAHVYRELRDRAEPFERAVVLGPAHHVALRGAAVPTVEAWASPLGPIAIDLEGARRLTERGLAVADDRPHAPEHSIEVQVPLLLRVQVRAMLPVLVGPGDPAAVAALLDAVAAPGTIVLCSTDLSHFLTDEEARRQDAATAAAVEDLAPERIGTGDACGRHPLRGLLTWARRRAPRVERLALATSADTGGPRDRVVGYAAFRLSA